MGWDDESSEKKKEFIFTIYQTLTPEDTSEAVISGLFLFREELSIPSFMVDIFISQVDGD